MRKFINRIKLELFVRIGRSLDVGTRAILLLDPVFFTIGTWEDPLRYGDIPNPAHEAPPQEWVNGRPVPRISYIQV